MDPNTRRILEKMSSTIIMTFAKKGKRPRGEPIEINDHLDMNPDDHIITCAGMLYFFLYIFRVCIGSIHQLNIG